MCNRSQIGILSFFSVLLVMVPFGQSHMQMVWPPPFRSPFNPHTSNIDYSMTSPLSTNGSDYPCKSYIQLFDTSEGQSVATWLPGHTYNFTLSGTTFHAGGSCQASLSFDRGASWKVVQSYIGQCPLRLDWRFTLPNDTPGGDGIFAWTWFNNLGNREMYMNCARVTIDRRATAKEEKSDPFERWPDMFAANIGNGCNTTEGKDLAFPMPGPNAVYNSKNTSPPVGNCGM